MTELMERISETFGPQALTQLVFGWAPSLLLAIASFLVFALLVYVVKQVLGRIFERVELDKTAAAFIQTVVRFALVTMGGLTVLDQLGVDTASILTSLGVMGLTLGFAAQNTLSNVISGLFIFWDRPFTLGDLVEVDGEYGRVENITLRSTRLVTVDGRMLAIPNTVIANTKVASYTNFPNLRLDVDVTVGVTEPLGKVREILLGLVEGDPAYLETPAPQVVVRELGDYFVRVELRAWLEDERAHIAERFKLRERIKVELDAAGVEMPFETLALAQVDGAPVSGRAASA